MLLARWHWRPSNLLAGCCHLDTRRRWATNQAMNMAMVAGMIKRGGRLKADFGVVESSMVQLAMKRAEAEMWLLGGRVRHPCQRKCAERTLTGC